MAAHRKIVRRASVTGNAELPGDFPPLLARIYLQRGIRHVQELDCSLADLIPADQLSGVDIAAVLLADAVRYDQRILVIGDFDADGATSTALALRALRSLGAGDVHYLVPNRFEYGYGLTPEIVAVAAELKPDVLITVDNGISSIEGVAAARGMGVKVVVTDHHLPAAHLPDADVIINPNQPDDPFPSKNLAGVGVIFYVMLGLRKQLREQNWFMDKGIEEPNLADLLDLVALGTVADVVPLDHNNRILVEQGLRRIRANKCIPAIRALLKIAKRNPAQVVASDIGFVVGPRLNAAGRLQDMSLGIECLLTNDDTRAMELAQQLDALNRERRNIEGQMQSEALMSVNNYINSKKDERLPHGLCLYDPGWHQGVIGILASRLKERFHRPVIAFADAGAGELKGSARSIQGLHIRDALDLVATRHPGLISKFGGHAMAAGLSLPQMNFDAFSEALENVLSGLLTNELLEGALYSDGQLDANDLNLETAELIRYAGPWGQSFPEPLFDGDFDVLERHIVGGHHLKMRLRPAGSRQIIDAIAFNTTDTDWPEGTERITIAYRLSVNEFRGHRNAQLLVENLSLLNS